MSTRLARTGRTATLLEWDARIPSFDEVHHEALKANRFIENLESQRNRRLSARPRARVPGVATAHGRSGDAAVERRMAACRRTSPTGGR